MFAVSAGRLTEQQQSASSADSPAAPAVTYQRSFSNNYDEGTEAAAAPADSTYDAVSDNFSDPAYSSLYHYENVAASVPSS